MSGPNNIDREKLRNRLDRQEFLGQVFGWTVGVGLIIEYWQEIVDCVVRHKLPPWPLIGGLLVTLGVFGEVWFSRLALKTAETISERADSDVALAKKGASEANERALNAERETTELQLSVAAARERQTQAEHLLVKLRLDQTPRSTRFPLGKFIEFLEPRAKTSVDIIFQSEDSEAALFAIHLWQGLIVAGWKIAGHPKPVPSDFTVAGDKFQMLSVLPAIMRAGGKSSGVTVVARSMNGRNPAYIALRDALQHMEILWSIGEDASLPEDVLRLIVGPKQ